MIPLDTNQGGDTPVAKTFMNEKELRELDAWIAEHVFRLKLNVNGMIETWPRPGVRHDVCVSSYTTDPAAAFAVLEKCIKSNRGRIVFEDWGTEFVVGFWNSDRELFYDEATAPTLPLAICLFSEQLFSK